MHETLFKSGKVLSVVFQKGSMQIRETYRPIGRGDFQSQLSKTLVISDAFAVQRIEPPKPELFDLVVIFDVPSL